MKIITQNRKARHDYFILDTYEAGIKLKGSEIKSIRAGKINIQDSYVTFKGGEAHLLGAHISKFDQSSILIMMRLERENYYLINQKLENFQTKLT